MAGHGPAPKDPAARRRRNEPARGEWVDLGPLGAPVLVVAESEWPSHVCDLWSAWRDDPVTSQYSAADRAAVLELARSWDMLAPSEQRLRMDGLGLSPKGKRDLRWRVVEADAPAVRSRRPSGRSHLKAV